jgi:hypothetical protein
VLGARKLNSLWDEVVLGSYIMGVAPVAMEFNVGRANINNIFNYVLVFLACENNNNAYNYVLGNWLG